MEFGFFRPCRQRPTIGGAPYEFAALLVLLGGLMLKITGSEESSDSV